MPMGSGRFGWGSAVPNKELTVPIRKSLYLNTPSSPKLTQSDINSAIFAPRCPRCRSIICPQV